MCGIVGLLTREGAFSLEQLQLTLGAMNDRLSHRGAR